MKKYYIPILLFVLFAVHLPAISQCLCRTESPHYQIISEVVNPKCVFPNYEAETVREMLAKPYQLPPELLPELTIDELVRYTLDSPSYLLSLPITVYGYETTGFNGYQELMARKKVMQELVNLVSEYEAKKDDMLTYHLLRFCFGIKVFKEFSLQQQLALLRQLSHILESHGSIFGTGAIMGDMDFHYLAGVVLQAYYPSTKYRQYVGDFPCQFECNLWDPKAKGSVANPKGIIREELFNVIQSERPVGKRW